MIIEFYGDQNLKELHKNVVFVFKRLTENRRCPKDKCSLCDKFNKINFSKWHPEQSGKYNDTWNIIELMEHYGYHSYEYDTVLYTSKFIYQETVGKPDVIITGDGLSFNQAVCNMFVKYGRYLKVLPA